MDDNKELNGLETLSRREIAEFNLWKEVYENKYPAPRFSVNGLGWQFWASVVVAIAGIVLAAFRTAQQFYLAAVYGGSVWFSVGEAASAVLAIEGTLVLFSAMHAYKHKKVSDFSSSVGRWVAFGISALAGVAQSLNLFSNNEILARFTEIFQVILVLALGFGATVIALFGGDILGVQVVDWENRKKDSFEHYQNALRSHNSKMLSRWRREREKEPSERTIVEPERKIKRTIERTNERRTGERREQIRSELQKICDLENRVAGVTELANQFGVAKSYVSTVRREWMTEKGIVENGEVK